MKKQLTFYFIRHGRTVWNEQGLMQGHGDSPLTEQGILGAQQAGAALQQIPFAAAYSSMLKRTIDTAEQIIGKRNIPLFQHKGLNEQYFGKWEGQSVEPLREQTEFKQMISDPANYKAETNGGETYQQLAERAMKAIQDIVQIHDKGNILVVSHGHTLRLLIALLGGATWQNHRQAGQSVSLLNTAISIVHYDSEKGFTVEKVNDTEHLG
ncbi:histidine phosphatase family protein [Rodentibacter caecimuris]|uniref:histidine phosphatase family protein n=1 Tax=Rodentibacter caecimuris TaxID=1796644 RepID=UPI00211A5132|nr:histidine phosphatase family protein [Rodentibacter heylii]MCQ9122691.1 histidine phosphatase family protein [Rodentibacter heylii]